MLATEVNLEDALSGPDRAAWIEAIYSEFRSLIENDTWDIVDKPPDRKVIGCRVVLRNKLEADGSLGRRKARVVAKGYAQRPGVDFRETFAPVARMGSFRLLIALAAKHDLHISQLDVETAFLNGKMDVEVLMDMPDMLASMLERMIADKSNPNVSVRARAMLDKVRDGNAVCKLKRSLYGLRQSGRQWYQELDQCLKKIGLNPTNADPCIYVDKNKFTYVLVYVNDLLIFYKDRDREKAIKSALSKRFRLKDLGDARHCLGIEIHRDNGKILLSQTGYIESIIEKFRMQDCKTVSTPLVPGSKFIPVVAEDDADYECPFRELIGALMYAATGTRPDIAHAVGTLSQFSSRPGKKHWAAAKRVLRYLKGTAHYALTYSKDNEALRGYVDADWANCDIDRRSFTGSTFIFAGAAISWESRKQRTVALSTTEAEYMAISDAMKEALHLLNFLKQLGIADDLHITLFNDNQGAGKLANNHMFHSRTKHIDVRHHFVRDVLQTKPIQLTYLSTDEMIADILTKGLPAMKHNTCLQGLGLTST